MFAKFPNSRLPSMIKLGIVANIKFQVLNNIHTVVLWLKEILKIILERINETTFAHYVT